MTAKLLSFPDLHKPDQPLVDRSNLEENRSRKTRVKHRVNILFLSIYWTLGLCDVWVHSVDHGQVGRQIDTVTDWPTDRKIDGLHLCKDTFLANVFCLYILLCLYLFIREANNMFLNETFQFIFGLWKTIILSLLPKILYKPLITYYWANMLQDHTLHEK